MGHVSGSFYNFERAVWQAGAQFFCLPQENNFIAIPSHDRDWQGDVFVVIAQSNYARNHERAIFRNGPDRGRAQRHGIRELGFEFSCNRCRREHLPLEQRHKEPAKGGRDRVAEQGADTGECGDRDWHYIRPQAPEIITRDQHKTGHIFLVTRRELKSNNCAPRMPDNERLLKL